MRTFFTLILLLYLVSCGGGSSLVEINAADFGDTESQMRLVEVERKGNISKLKLTSEKRSCSVGGAMFIMRGFYEVAKARGAEYFVNLKEWEGADGAYYYIGGFTNEKNADIHAEFGEEYTLTNEAGQDRGYMSVSECGRLWGNQDEGNR